MSGHALAAVYCVCVTIWGLTILGTCTWLVFYEGHSGWWYVLAVFLCANETSKNMRRIAGQKVEQ